MTRCNFVKKLVIFAWNALDKMWCERYTLWIELTAIASLFGVFMLQRLKSVSSLGGALLVMGALVSACSTWGGNPPPRYNTVIGEKRVPALNPGGNKIVRPADAIEPAAPANIVRPQSQRVVPQSYESAMNDSNVIQVAPQAEVPAVSAAASVPAPAITPVEEKSMEMMQPTPQQLAAAAPAAGGAMSITPSPAMPAASAQGDIAQAKQEMKYLAAERDQMSVAVAPAPSAAPNNAVDSATSASLAEQAGKLFSATENNETVKIELPSHIAAVVPSSAPAVQNVQAAAAEPVDSGWHTVNVAAASKPEDVARVAIPNNQALPAAPFAQVPANETKPVEVAKAEPEMEKPIMQASAAPMVAPSAPVVAPVAATPVEPAPLQSNVAEQAAPPVFTRNADGSWGEKPDTSSEVAEISPAAPSQTVFDAPVNTTSNNVAGTAEVSDAPAVIAEQATDSAATSSVVASAGAHASGDYLPPSRYARYRSGYQNYRLNRLSGAVSTN